MFELKEESDHLNMLTIPYKGQTLSFSLEELQSGKQRRRRATDRAVVHKTQPSGKKRRESLLCSRMKSSRDNRIDQSSPFFKDLLAIPEGSSGEGFLSQTALL